jgi:hypothetical protein
LTAEVGADKTALKALADGCSGLGCDAVAEGEALANALSLPELLKDSVLDEDALLMLRNVLALAD